MARSPSPGTSRLAVAPMLFGLLAVAACSSIFGADFNDVHVSPAPEADAACAGDACGPCIPLGESCAPSTTCCGGAICNSLQARCEACGIQGGSCRANADCCADLACDLDSETCQPSATCSADGTSCVSPAACCSGVCNASEKRCDECGNAGRACIVDGDCCAAEGLVCDPTTRNCAPGSSCLASGAPCGVEAGADCCAQLVCNSFYQACQACGGVGGGCNVDGDCCSGTTCNTAEHACEASSASCGLGGTSCDYTASCCAGLYCDSAQGADGGAKSCTTTPQCKEVGDTTCSSYADCCEGAGNMDCCASGDAGTLTGCWVVGCCIDAKLQNTAQIACHQDSDCCSDSCDVPTGKCNARDPGASP